MTQLNSRERQALETMDLCPYRFEVKGKFSAGVGSTTLAGLVERGLAEVGESPRHKGAMGWAITEAGRAALRAPKIPAPRKKAKLTMLEPRLQVIDTRTAKPIK